MLIDKIKIALRTTTDDEGINNQIQSLIDSSIIDLRSANIKVVIDENEDCDPLVTTAIACYVKGYFYNDGEKYLQAYNMLKTQLCILGEYNV